MKKALLLYTLLYYTLLLSAQERITLLFAGDLMQHQGQIDAARTPQGTYDYSSYFTRVKEQISQADLAIGNLEVTLGGAPYRGYPCFSAPDEYLQAIQDAGFDILLTANNHCLDRGQTGLERTIEQLDAHGIPHLGTYRNPEERERNYPLLIEKKGFRIAFLNYTYGTNGIRATAPNIVNYIDKQQIWADIQTAKAGHPDAIIACMHWGEEYRLLPNAEQRHLADWLLENGVTHVIGAHPHVIQPMELRADSIGHRHAVVYSLGNFISNMRAVNTDGGLIFTMTLEKQNAFPSFSPIPWHRLRESPSSDTPCTSHPETSFSIPFPENLFTPVCRLVHCYYNLVWVGRPPVTGQKNFTLYPVETPSDSLTSEAVNRMKVFTQNARQIFRRHNIGISEQSHVPNPTVPDR